jgi:NADH-quinone oxidoreductase subunit F
MPGHWKLENALREGAYEGLRAAVSKSPEELIDLVKRSGLRGRGGAGFPTGLKWSFVPKNLGKPVYLCVNGDESEPGTFKDREIMERDPHLVLEGSAIAAWALGVKVGFIYLRGEFVLAIERLEAAIAEATAKGFLGERILGTDFSLRMVVHRGAGAYICGEETALIESLEGKRGHPRLKPPFPAVVGLYDCPTVVNNVETLANLPDIVTKGPEWFAGIGTPKNAGTKVFCVSGHVKKPGNYELPLGVPLRSLLYDTCGGIRGDRGVKAVIPGGSSAPVLNASEIDVPMDFDSLAKAGSMLGSAGVIVMDDSTCMVGAAKRIMQFYAEESCGQCTPCREGTHWLHTVLTRFEAGRGRMDEIDTLLDIGDNMMGKAICPLADAAVMPTASILRKFRSEFEEHAREGRCPAGGRLSAPSFA